MSQRIPLLGENLCGWFKIHEIRNFLPPIISHHVVVSVLLHNVHHMPVPAFMHETKHFKEESFSQFDAKSEFN